MHTHSHSWYIAVVVHQVPLMADEVEPQHMIVNLVGILIEAAKGVDLVVPAIRHRCVDQTGGSLAQGAGNLGPVAIHHGAALHGRVGHNVGVVRRARGRGQVGVCWLWLLARGLYVTTEDGRRQRSGRC